MTMVAACHFADGAVIIADSRATWVGSGVPIFQDELQKILSLGPKIGLAFAGDILPRH
jgi:20S proteasome alpha/beta subunit